MVVLVLTVASLPSVAFAGIFSFWAELTEVFSPKSVSAETSSVNSQNVAILQATRGVEFDGAKGGGDITIVGTALLPESGPVGTMADIAEGNHSESISVYVVRKGDTVSSIAKMFEVTSQTVLWANDLSGSVIREGQVLVILPISGVRHTVVKGDTVSSIAKKYKADAGEVARYNSIATTSTLKPGDIIIVPDGEVASPVTKYVASGTSNPLRGGGGPAYDGYYLRPILNGRKTQALHGYNGVDLATYLGAPVFASAEGDVIVSAKSGWNGGDGKYVVIAHPNGTQTLYSHLSEVDVSVGDHVVRGAQIGQVGSTGKSTGPHLHFEIRGAKNPF